MALLSYIFMCIVYPMKERNNFNYGLVFFLSSMIVLTGIHEIFEYCTSNVSIVLGFLLGITFGLLNYVLFKNLDNDFFKFTMTSDKMKDGKKCYFTIGNQYVCNEASGYNVSNKDFANLINIVRGLLVFIIIFYIANKSIKFLLIPTRLNK